MSIIQRTKIGQYIVTIPQALAEAIRLEPGEKVKWVVTKKGTIEMIRMD